MNTIRICISVFACAAAVTLQASATSLFSGGTTDWKIAYEACETNTPVAYGARELQAALKKMSGAEFAAGEGAAGAKTLYIGVDKTLPKPGDEVVVIRLKGDSVELVGNEPRAALHAVYAFLQRELGVRWIGPGDEAEFIPKRTSWEVPVKPEWRHTPSVKYRGFNCTGRGRYQRPEYFAWLARNFVSYLRPGVDRPELRCLGFYNFLSVSSGMITRRDDLWKEHPEYFTFINGARARSNTCMSDEGCLRTFADIAVKAIRNGGLKADGVGFSLSDNCEYCKCEKCAKLSVSDAYFGFANRLGKLIHAEVPGIEIVPVAYQGYREPPSFPLDEVAWVRYTTHARCNRHFWADPKCPRNDYDRSVLKAWEKSGMKLGQYGYEFDAFHRYAVWEPVFSIANDQVDDMMRRGHVAFCTEIGMAQRSDPELAVRGVVNRLPVLFYSLKMWDASLTVEAFLDDITKTAFGPAAAPMKRYFTTFDKAWCAPDDRHMGILGSGLPWTVHILKPETKAALDAAMAEAEKLIASATPQQKLAFAREKTLYRQWTDLLELSKGAARTLQLPRVADASGIPAAASRGVALLGPDGRETTTRLRAAWTEGPADRRGRRLPQDLLVEFSDVPEGAETSFRFVSGGGSRYTFTQTQSGERAQERISEVGIRDAHFAPAWQAKREGNVVRMTVPLSALGGVSVGEDVMMHFDVRTEDAVRRYPVREDMEAGAKIAPMAFVDVPLLACVRNRRRPVNKSAECADAVSAGFDVACAEDVGECDALLNPRPRVFLFLNASLKAASPALREAVLKSVHDEGGIVLFYGCARMDTAGFMGDKAYATTLDKPMGLPLSQRRSTYVRPGGWLDRPFESVGRRVKGGISPAYAQKPLDSEGWTDYARIRGVETPEVRTLMMKPYGKGRVFVAGTRFAVSVYEILANLWEEQCADISRGQGK